MMFYILLEKEFKKRAAEALGIVGAKLRPSERKDISVDTRKKKPYYIRSRW